MITVDKSIGSTLTSADSPDIVTAHLEKATGGKKITWKKHFFDQFFLF